MQVKLITGDGSRTVEATENQTVLDVIQSQEDIPFQAPCGGHGTCGKCRVLIRDEEGLNHHLACQTKVKDGIAVIIERERVMKIQEGGTAVPFEVAHRPEGQYGIAIDVGTTTVVCHLHDLSTGKRLATASCANPQIVFGADCISRITASINGKLNAMRHTLLVGLRSLVDDCCKEAGVSYDQIVDATLVGNTVMEHIAAGLAPDTMGGLPFTTLSLFGDYHEMGDKLPKMYFAPAVAAYVGGDITAGMLASGFNTGKRVRLFIDIGTNGEMAIGDEDRIISCATAAGPAFEGAGIYFGMPAAPGAISQVKWDGEKLNIKVIDDVEPVGVCGTGLIDALAAFIDMGLVDETGRISDDDEVDPAVASYLGEDEDGSIIYLTEGHEVYITQKDVRNLQLAKAAICGGTLTLCDAYGVSINDVEELLIGGGFGSYIDLRSAARIGLYPPVLYPKAKSVGNVAGEGAAAVLISTEARDEIGKIDKLTEYVELSLSSEFNEHYIECMGFGEDDDDDEEGGYWS